MFVLSDEHKREWYDDLMVERVKCLEMTLLWTGTLDKIELNWMMETI